MVEAVVDWFGTWGACSGGGAFGADSVPVSGGEEGFAAGEAGAFGVGCGGFGLGGSGFH